MSNRNSQVSRIYKILTLLETHHFGLSVVELWQRLSDHGIEVAERTIYRDLEALEQAGFPLIEKGKSEEGGAKWVIDSKARTGDFLALTPREVLALYLARRALAPLKQMPFQADLQSLFDKLEDRLGSRNEVYYKDLRDDLQFDSTARFANGISPEVTDAVHAACIESQILETTYESANSRTVRKRKIGPHYLYFSQDSLYLVGEDLEDSTVKVFALPRMKDAVMLDEPYAGQKTEPAQTFGSSFGVYTAASATAVCILFIPPIAAYVSERVWHASQRVKKLQSEPGNAQQSETQLGVELSFQIGITPELVQWVLSFGKNARVLEPESLARAVQEAASEVVRCYETARTAS